MAGRTTHLPPTLDYARPRRRKRTAWSDGLVVLLITISVLTGVWGMFAAVQLVPLLFERDPFGKSKPIDAALAGLITVLLFGVLAISFFAAYFARERVRWLRSSFLLER